MKWNMAFENYFGSDHQIASIEKLVLLTTISLHKAGFKCLQNMRHQLK